MDRGERASAHRKGRAHRHLSRQGGAQQWRRAVIVASRVVTFDWLWSHCHQLAQGIIADLLNSVIPECFYRESTREQNEPPIKTFGDVGFGRNAHRYDLMPRSLQRGSSSYTRKANAHWYGISDDSLIVWTFLAVAEV